MVEIAVVYYYYSFIDTLRHNESLMIWVPFLLLGLYFLPLFGLVGKMKAIFMTFCHHWLSEIELTILTLKLIKSKTMST